MANWKKVIVSGSNADLNHITASGNISASGFLFGNLPEDPENDKVVIYNATTGRLEFKTLNLVNARRAPEVFLLDFDTDRTDNKFSLSFDSGSTTQPITAPFQFSASLDGGTSFPVSSSNTLLNINGGWDDVDIGNNAYFDPNASPNPINKTASISEGNPDGPEDYRNGLITGGSKTSIDIHINRLNSNGATAVPAFTPGPAYDDAAFDSPQGVVGTTAGDTGSIQVFVNGMDTPKATFSLTGSSNSTITTAVNNITPAFSVSGAAVSTGDETDFTKSFRTGKFTIGTTHQVDGYNYAFVFYTGSRGGTQVRALTNFTEWFYDTDGAGEAMSDTNDYDFSWTGLDATSVVYRSGIKYYDAGGADSSTAEYKVKQVNQYRNIYPHPSDSSGETGFEVTYNSTPADSLTITQGSSEANHLATNPTTTSPSPNGSNQIALAPLADLNNAHLSNTEVTASMGVEFGELTTMNAQGTSGGIHFPGAFVSTGRPWDDNSTQLDLDLAIEFQHPNKTNKTKPSTGVDSFLVLANQNINANVTQYEDFKNETFRITASAYTNFSDPTTAAGTWNSQTNIVNGGNGHNGGLLTFMSYLIYPNYAGKSADGGDYGSTYGPSQANDYSPSGTSATGEREYYRYFTIPASLEGDSQLNIEFIGSGSICGDANTAQFGTGKPGFKVFANRTGDSSGNSIMNGTFVNAIDNKVGTNLGSGESIPLDLTSVNYSDSSTIATGGATSVPTGIVKINDPNADSFATGDHVIIKIVTGQNWTGFINAMAITAGNTQQLGRVIGSDETNF